MCTAASTGVFSRGAATTYWSNAGRSDTTPLGAAAPTAVTSSRSIQPSQPSTLTGATSSPSAVMSLPACAADAIPNQRAYVSRDAGPYAARYRRMTAAIDSRGARPPVRGQPAIRPREAHLLTGRLREHDVAAEGGELGHRPEAPAHGLAQPRAAEPLADASASSSRVSGLAVERVADRVEHGHRLGARHGEGLAPARLLVARPGHALRADPLRELVGRQEVQRAAHRPRAHDVAVGPQRLGHRAARKPVDASPRRQLHRRLHLGTQGADPRDDGHPVLHGGPLGEAAPRATRHASTDCQLSSSLTPGNLTHASACGREHAGSTVHTTRWRADLDTSRYDLRF